MKKLLLVTGLSLGFASPALAANYSGLTSAVDFTDAIAAIMAVAALVAAVLVVRKGIRFVLGSIR